MTDHRMMDPTTLRALAKRVEAGERGPNGLKWCWRRPSLILETRTFFVVDPVMKETDL